MSTEQQKYFFGGPFTRAFTALHCFLVYDIMFQTLIGTKKNAMNDLLYQTTEYALGLIAAGNEAGVDILYEYMGKTMLFVAKNVVKDDFAAEDVVQESFLKIVKNISKYKRGTNGYAWVCRIVRNTALNALKSENVRGGRSIDEFVNITDGKDFEEMSQTRMLAEKILNSLSPPIVKQMVYMKYFLDMTVREIAKAVGKSKSYVSKELIKAEEKMKTMLQDAWTK